MCSNELFSLLKVIIYIGLLSSSAAGRWSQQCLCCIYMFAFSAQVLSPPEQGLQGNGSMKKFLSSLFTTLPLHIQMILQVVLLCVVTLYFALLHIFI